MMAMNSSTSNIPRFEMVNVPPPRSSERSLFVRARSVRALDSAAIFLGDFFSRTGWPSIAFPRPDALKHVPRSTIYMLEEEDAESHNHV